jgi:hypothetical protein
MRDRLTHDYFGVDLGLVWRVSETVRTQEMAPVLATLTTSPDQRSTAFPQVSKEVVHRCGQIVSEVDLFCYFLGYRWHANLRW